MTYTCSIGGMSGTCPATGVVDLLGLPAGRTLTFRVTATDAAGNVDPTGASLMFTTPVNDRKLDVARGKWRNVKSSDAYRGTYREARTGGSTLSLPTSGVLRLALVATTMKGAGKVAVFLGDQRLRTIDLSKGSPATSRLFDLATFTSPVAGRIRIVSLSGKPVRVEGVALTGTTDVSRRSARTAHWF